MIILYCVAVAAASLAGGAIPALFRLTHAGTQLLVSCVGGLMLGVALFHMIPHAALETGSLEQVMTWTVVGLLTTFFLIRAFHFHQHGPAEEDGQHDHDHDHGHDHDHDDVLHSGDAHAGAVGHGTGAETGAIGHRFNWIGLGVGLGIHTLLDGVALAASVRSDAHGAPDSWLLGLGTAIAVCAHKPLDSMSLIALMATAGWPTRSRRIVNFVYALICPLGAALFWLGADRLGGGGQTVIGCSLAFSGGLFLCISLGDLLPEVQFHSHDRLKLSAALLIGVAAAWCLRYFEPAHVHNGSHHAPRRPRGTSVLACVRADGRSRRAPPD